MKKTTSIFIFSTSLISISAMVVTNSILLMDSTAKNIKTTLLKNDKNGKSSTFEQMSTKEVPKDWQSHKILKGSWNSNFILLTQKGYLLKDPTLKAITDTLDTPTIEKKGIKSAEMFLSAFISKKLEFINVYKQQGNIQKLVGKIHIYNFVNELLELKSYKGEIETGLKVKQTYGFGLRESFFAAKGQQAPIEQFSTPTYVIDAKTSEENPLLTVSYKEKDAAFEGVYFAREAKLANSSEYNLAFASIRRKIADSLKIDESFVREDDINVELIKKGIKKRYISYDAKKLTGFQYKNQKLYFQGSQRQVFSLDGEDWNPGDKVYAVFNVPGGDISTATKVYFNMANPTKPERLVKLVENPEIRNTGSTVLNKTIYTTFKIGSYTKTLFGQIKWNNDWPDDSYIKFDDGSTFKNGFTIEGNNIYFTGKIISDVPKELVLNVYRNIDGKEFKWSPSPFYIRISQELLPLNAQKVNLNLAENNQEGIEELSKIGTVVGQIVSEVEGLNYRYSSTSLDFSVSETGEITVSKRLRLPVISSRPDGNGGTIQDRHHVLTVAVFSQDKGRSVSQIYIPVKENSYKSSVVFTKNSWNTLFKDKNNQTVGTFTIPEGESVELVDFRDNHSEFFKIEGNNLIYSVDENADTEIIKNYVVGVVYSNAAGKKMYKALEIEFDEISQAEFDEAEARKNDTGTFEGNWNRVEKIADADNEKYGQLKKSLVPFSEVVDRSEIVESSDIPQANYVGSRFSKTTPANTKYNKNLLNKKPNISDFRNSIFATKTYDQEETITYKFKNDTSKNLRYIDIYQTIPAINNVFKISSKKSDLNSPKGPIFTVNEWKQYLDVKYIKEDGTEKTLDKSLWHFERIETFSYKAQNDDVKKYYLQRIVIPFTALNAVTAVKGIELVWKPLPRETSPLNQKYHSFSKIGFGIN